MENDKQTNSQGNLELRCAGAAISEVNVTDDPKEKKARTLHVRHSTGRCSADPRNYCQLRAAKIDSLRIPKDKNKIP
jgi:hypothetical protein